MKSWSGNSFPFQSPKLSIVELLELPHSISSSSPFSFELLWWSVRIERNSSSSVFVIRMFILFHQTTLKLHFSFSIVLTLFFLDYMTRIVEKRKNKTRIFSE
jgi:hypothetical protein